MQDRFSTYNYYMLIRLNSNFFLYLFSMENRLHAYCWLSQSFFFPFELKDLDYYSTCSVSRPTAVIPRPTAVIPRPTAVIPRPTAVIPRPTAVIPRPTAVIPRPTAVIPRPTAPYRDLLHPFATQHTLSRPK